MSKSIRSFSVDEDIDELLAEREDINASAVVNKFLREYIAGGKGTEAALEARIQQLDGEIADLEKDLQRKRRERERLNNQVERERQSMHEAVDELVTMVHEGDFFRENLDVDNDAVVKKASEAGVPTERFIEEVEARL